MTVEKLLELREKIGDEPIMPDAEDKYEVMQMMKQPETMEEMQAAAKLNRGEDPESQGSFDVEDVDGQRRFTEVRLDPEDMEDLV